MMSSGHSTTTPAGYRSAMLMLSLGQLVCWASLYFAFSSFVLPMQQDLGWSKSVLMGAFTLGLTIWGLAALPVGAAIDRGHGRRVLVGGSLLGGLCFLLWSQVSEPWMLYAVFSLMGVAMSMTLYEPVFAIVTRRYPSHFRDGITTLTLVGGFATTLSFPAALWLIQALGWRAALVATGLVLLAVIAPLHALAMRGEGGTVHPDGEAQGAHSDGPHPAPMTSPQVTDPTQADASMADALRCAAFWLLAATFAGYSFVASALWAHVIPALHAKGLDEGQALAVLVWVGPAQVASRVLFRFCGAALTPRRLGYGVFFGQALAFLLFALADSQSGLIAFAVLFGVVSGLAAIVRGNLVPAYFGRAQVGRIGGALSSSGLYARAAAPVGAAALLAWPMGYEAVMLVLAAISLLALLAYALARKPVFEPRN
jgi:MFS family permease